MKRLLILSLLMVQGVWAVDAANAQTHNQPRSLKEFALLEVMLPLLTRLSDALAQDPNAAMDESDANNLEIILGIYKTPERIFEALYVAWLNADTTRAIVVRQNGVQAFQQMGIDNVPEEWAQLIIDVSPYLRDGITSLHTRPGTIAHLVHTNQMPAPVNGRLDLSNQRIAVCDAWNISNPGVVTTLSLRHNQLTALSAGAFEGLGSLTILLLDNNQLTALPAGVFNELGNLTFLSLSHNQLTALSYGVFAGLGNLTFLWLGENQSLQLEGLNDLQAIKEQYPEWFSDHMGQLLKLYHRNRTLAVDDEWLYPGVFQRVYPVGVVHGQSAAAAEEEDEAVCIQCGRVGDACICSADGAG